MFPIIVGIHPLKRPGTEVLRRHCPRCNDLRNFREIKVRPYFSFFFIPLFPVGRPGRFFACPTCSYGVSDLEAREGVVTAETQDTPAETGPKVVLICPRCEGPMRLARPLRRQQVTCPHCSMEFTVKSIPGDIPAAILK
jgi:uncharacterized Zn finger protein (UPF0148 family)